MDWYVAIDRPYYPTIEGPYEHEEAAAIARKWVEEEYAEDGQYQSKVFIFLMDSRYDIKTYY